MNGDRPPPADRRRGPPEAALTAVPGCPGVSAGGPETAAGGTGAGGPAFLQVAGLEPDELVDRLAARVHGGQGAQARLRCLLRATVAVAHSVDLEDVLRRLADAARGLVRARYAAVGMVQDGRLVRFVHAGVDRATAERIGHLPEGRGLLGQLIDQPLRLRLSDLAEHARAAGFPEGHPPMRSFLGVPLRVRDRVFGVLYLADKQDADEFTAEDEDLVGALAAAAGVAIENANLFAESRRRQQWQAALVEITTQLLTGTDPAQTLRQMVRHARCASGADAAGVTVPTDDPALLRVAVAEGRYASWEGAMFLREGSASAIAMAGRRPVLVADLGTDPRVRPTEGRPVEIGPTVVAPIASDQGVIGVLVVSKSRVKCTFDRSDLDMIGSFATQAALALELAETRRDHERLQLLEDRERIGADLQHSVIQRLFALGLSIQAIAVRVGDAEVKRLITDRVEDIDDIISDIRATVFALRTS
ncbi:GAF domain-containing protein [Planosporangium sp. 12N6]|uniref:GAF domain-containing protein n=1 Tax=Planosporangium spinosum TaxID=3402278 RepID=UPI003CF9E38F